VDAAWRVVQAALRQREAPALPDEGPMWQPWCRECMVPECEHQLFRRLVKG
jgi:hypothetical protein